MREIEFRGKRIDYNDWEYGYIIAVYTEYIDDFGIIPKFTGGFAVQRFDGYVLEVDSNTIGQHTGLKDKNGTKIFEGDVVEWTWIETNEKRIGKVTWNNGGFTFENLHNETLYCNLMQQDKWEYKVIGNIYDNPELLEVKDGKM